MPEYKLVAPYAGSEAVERGFYAESRRISGSWRGGGRGGGGVGERERELERGSWRGGERERGRKGEEEGEDTPFQQNS